MIVLAPTERWRAPVVAPELGPGEVHVFMGRVPSALGLRWAEVLSREERARAGRFHFEGDARRFVFARGMLRRVVAGYLAEAPEALRLVEDPWGKPHLDGRRPGALAVNLAHSGDRVLCALARDAVGVDVEVRRDGLDIQDLAERFFCRRERERLRAAGPARRRSLFFRYWVLKEAYLKALGTGIGAGLDTVDVADLAESWPEDPRPAAGPGADRRVLLTLLPVGSGVAAAVAAGGERWRPRLWLWNA